MNNNAFVAYEYLTVSSKPEMEPLYKDCYQSLGWTLDSTMPSITGGISLRLKRDRRIKTRQEICALQAQCETALGAIGRLEQSKTTDAMSASLLIGFLGTALMAGSVFSYLAGQIALCVILAIPAFAGWIIPYFLYRTVKKKQARKINERIDSQYDLLYNLCEKANALLN